MDMDIVERALKQYKQDCPGDDITLHSMGEPLTHPAFWEIIRLIKEESFGIRLTTNAFLINTVEKVQYLIQNCNNLNISIEGVDKETYESFRKGASFDHLLWVLDTIHNNRHINPDFRLGIYSLVDLNHNQDENKNTIEKFYQFYSKYTRQILFRAYGNQGSNSNLEYASSIHSTVRCSCVSPFVFLLVRPNGQISYCCADINGFCDIGNILSDSLSVLWNGIRLNEIRTYFNNNDYHRLPINCQTCSSTFTKTAKFEEWCNHNVLNVRVHE